MVVANVVILGSALAVPSALGLDRTTRLSLSLLVLLTGYAALMLASAAVIEGRSKMRSGNWSEVEALDDRLAQVAPGSLLYREALRLRCGWRLASQVPENGRVGLELVETLVRRDRSNLDILLRAELAELAGKPDYAWASLGRLSGSFAGKGNRGALARRAWVVASKLPPNDDYQGMLRFLRSQFR